MAHSHVSSVISHDVEDLIALYNQGKVSEVLEKGEAFSPHLRQSYLVYNIMGAAYAQIQNPEKALASYQKALESKPDFAAGYNNLANVLCDLKRYDDAIKAFKKALEITPTYAEACYNLGCLHYELKDYRQAQEMFERAVALRPLYIEAYINLGNVLCDLKFHEEGIASFKKALSIEPHNADAYNNLGHVLNELKRHGEALLACQRAVEIKPDFIDAYTNLAVALFELKRHRDVIAVCRKTLSIHPQHAPAYFNMGNAFYEMKQYEDAIAAYTKALEYKRSYEGAFSLKLNMQSQICDWSTISEDQQNIPRCGLSDPSASPFALFHLEDNPKNHQARAQVYATKKVSRRELASIPRNHTKKERVRIGYFSADFRDHIVGRLVSNLFERHDRSRFEVYAYSFGPNTKDPLRERIQKGVDVFRSVETLQDQEIALLARNDQIDIAIDLMGYTQLSRSSIFAYRAAPLQINYLGYPGTMGATFMEYLIADRFVIPESSRQLYSEKILYLPNNFLLCDGSQEISERPMTRSEMGLPEEGFVFCCFNNVYKIRPEEFTIWMRLLQKVEGSVLWLPSTNPKAVENLRKEAANRGVNPQRLLFGERLALPEYLKRYQLADLFLDTFNFNAHSTASDVLSAGLPLLTKAGRGFPARVAGSLLNTLKIPELITETSEEYEQRAFELATNKEKLEAIKKKLHQNKKTTPLFDLGLFTQHLEEAYSIVFERWSEGKDPETLEIA